MTFVVLVAPAMPVMADVPAGWNLVTPPRPSQFQECEFARLNRQANLMMERDEGDPVSLVIFFPVRMIGVDLLRQPS